MPIKKVSNKTENNKIEFILEDFKNFLWRHENNRSRIHSIEG